MKRICIYKDIDVKKRVSVDERFDYFPTRGGEMDGVISSLV